MSKHFLWLLLLATCHSATLPVDEERFQRFIACIKAGNLKRLKKLLPHVSINHRDPQMGATPLLWAVLYDRRDMIQALSPYHPDVTIPNYYGTTPLHASILNRDYDFYPYAFRHGADIYAQNSAGQTPWELALQDLPVRRYFMEHEEQLVANEAEQESARITQRYEASKKRHCASKEPETKRQLNALPSNQKNTPLLQRRTPTTWEGPPRELRSSKPAPKILLRVYRNTVTTKGTSTARLKK